MKELLCQKSRYTELKSSLILWYSISDLCGGAWRRWLACLHGAQKVAGSNPVAPTKKAHRVFDELFYMEKKSVAFPSIFLVSFAISRKDVPLSFK